MSNKLVINAFEKIFQKFVYWLFWVLVQACGILFPDQGSNLGPLHWDMES